MVALAPRLMSCWPPDGVGGGSAFLVCVCDSCGRKGQVSVRVTAATRWRGGRAVRASGREAAAGRSGRGGQGEMGGGEELCDARLPKYKKYHFITL